MRLAILLGLVLCTVCPCARAHDPYESTTVIVVRPERIELTLALAQSTALRLIDPDARIRALEPANMPEHTPRLEREARLLFILTSGNKQLAPTKVRVELTDENDIVFTVAYPRPAAGRLLVHAAFLRRLGDGYGGLVTVDDEANRNLGWDQLHWPRASFDVAIPRAAPTPRN
ncbi:MAG: hypothetical protein JNL39_10395 [Opitutaceae bacterium]|nr:hypothetical protein [Opitutaceae bacterium]